MNDGTGGGRRLPPGTNPLEVAGQFLGDAFNTLGTTIGEGLGFLPDAQERAYQDMLKQGQDRLASGNYYDTVLRPEEYRNINQAYTDRAMNAASGAYGNYNNFITSMLGGGGFDVNQFYQNTVPTISNFVRGEMSPLEQAANERMNRVGRQTIQQVGDEFAGLGSLYSGATRRTAADRVGEYNAQTQEALTNTQANMMQNLINPALQASLANYQTNMGTAGSLAGMGLQGLLGLGEQNYVAPTKTMNPLVQMYLESTGGMPTKGGGTDPLDFALNLGSMIPGPQQPFINMASGAYGA